MSKKKKDLQPIPHIRKDDVSVRIKDGLKSQSSPKAEGLRELETAAILPLS